MSVYPVKQSSSQRLGQGFCEKYSAEPHADEQADVTTYRRGKWLHKMSGSINSYKLPTLS